MWAILQLIFAVLSIGFISIPNPYHIQYNLIVGDLGHRRSCFLSWNAWLTALGSVYSSRLVVRDFTVCFDLIGGVLVALWFILIIKEVLVIMEGWGALIGHSRSSYFRYFVMVFARGLGLKLYVMFAFKFAIRSSFRLLAQNSSLLTCLEAGCRVRMPAIIVGLWILTMGYANWAMEQFRHPNYLNWKIIEF